MRKVKILVIDDDAAILETISMILEMDGGFEVATLDDARQWVSVVKTFRPDVILVDYRMPTMTGDQFIRMLNASEFRATVRTVGLFSATPLTADEVQKFGADFFVEKPFNIDRLTSILKQLDVAS